MNALTGALRHGKTHREAVKAAARRRADRMDAQEHARFMAEMRAMAYPPTHQTDTIQPDKGLPPMQAHMRSIEDLYQRSSYFKRFTGKPQ